MSEENISSIRRNKKVAGVEDPIVIIQRLLNIFRQRHILDEKQKADFNNMILQQPPEIRHMCSVLPGGSLLQEYIDELEEQNGIAPNEDSGDSTNDGTILSNALADTASTQNAPQNPTPVATPTVDNTQSLELQKQMLQMMQNMQNQSTPQTSGGTTVFKPDANFAKDIATAIAGALAQSEEKRQKELISFTQSLTQSQREMTSSLIKEISKGGSSSHIIASDSGESVKVIDNTKEITKAITESQLEMAKMFLQQNAINASNNANNANNIQINNAPFANPQDFIADIIKAQSQLFREMAKEQTKEISSIISGALKESSQLSNQYLVKALSEFHKENLDFLKQQSKNQTVYYQPLPQVSGDHFAPNLDTSVHDEKEEKNSSGLKQVFKNMFNLNTQESSNSSYEPEPTVENENIESSSVLAEENDEALSIPSSNEEESNENISNMETASIDENITSTSSKKKKKKKKKKKNNEEQNLQPLSPADLELQDLLGFSDEGKANNVDNEISTADLNTAIEPDIGADKLPELDVANDFSDDNDISFITNDDDKTSFENSEFSNIPDLSSEINSDENSISASDALLNTDIEEENNTVSTKAISNEPSEKTSSISEKDNNSEVVNAQPKKQSLFNKFLDNLDTKNALEQLISPFHKEEKTSATEELLSDNQTDTENTTQDNDDDAGDWEWEYEEEPAEPEENSDVNLAQESNSTTDDNNDGEWEWEYEEEPAEPEENSDVNLAQESNSTVDDNNDGEWEWEYEEEPAEPEENSDVNLAQESNSTTDDNNDGEWEWEYEEEPAEAEENSDVNLAQESNSTTDNNNDGEWEWEYEEEPAEPEENSDVNLAPEENTITDDQIIDVKGEKVPTEKIYNTDASAQSESARDPAQNDDVDFSELFDNFMENDPYSSSETITDDLEASGLKASNISQYPDIPAPKATLSAPIPTSQPEEEDDFFLPDFNIDADENEPYHTNNDLKH